MGRLKLATWNVNSLKVRLHHSAGRGARVALAASATAEIEDVCAGLAAEPA